MAGSIVATSEIARGTESALVRRLRAPLAPQALALFSILALAPSAMAAGHESPATIDPTRSTAVGTMASGVDAARSDTARSVPTALASDTDWSLPPIRFGHEARPPVLPALYVVYGALQVYDVYSTMHALGSGASEGNPFLKDIARNPAALIGLKAGMTGASILVSERLWRTHHRPQAIAFMLASNGVMAIVAAHNAGAAR